MPGISIPADLGDGLVLRRATARDVDALVAFNVLVHGSDEEPNMAAGAGVSDLLGRRHPHPTTGVDQFTIVEDMTKGAIASSMCLIPQTWLYDGVEFPATLIEMVGTLPEYRNRGLVRKQFEVVNGWCVERGILAQAIAGIPWYYRQFGYEYALPLSTSRVARRASTPKLDGDEPVHLRPAVADDAAFIAGLEAENRANWLVSTVRNEAVWRYEIAGRDDESDSYVHVLIIERRDETPIGAFAYSMIPGDPPWMVSFDVAESVSWLSIVPTVLRHMLAVADARIDEERREAFLMLELGRDHPAYLAMPDVLKAPSSEYALMLRVADLAAFMTLIGPALERRLAGSVARGFSGELPINFYRGGLRMIFTDGSLTGVTSERMEADVPASFPDLSFLPLLFGYRSLTEIDNWYPDCRISTNEARALLDALFPKQRSYIWPIW